MRLSALFAWVAISTAGCAAIRATCEEAKATGFLGDYSMLRPGRSAEAERVFIAPDAELARYDTIDIYEVSVWDGGNLGGIAHSDQSRLADSAYRALRDALAKDFRIAERKGPGVLRLRAAITDGEGSVVPTDALSTQFAGPELYRSGEVLYIDTGLALRKASGEIDITDSVSKRRLVAAVDERVGARDLSGAGDTWDDVDHALDRWAERVRARIAAIRAGHRRGE